MGVFAEFLSYKLGPGKHVAPLVIAAELHIAAVVLEHIVEIIRLHDHIVELKEAQSSLPALLVALGP